jgi:hypothetical protein
MANFDKALNIADKKLFGNQFTSAGVETFKKGLFNINKGKYSDPTFLGFTLLFDWESPLLSPSDEGDTALAYLKRTGEVERYEMLETFQITLRSLNKEMPWYWQSIDGLQRAWQLMTDFTDPFRGGREARLEIGTLESIDLRMASILALYRKVAFDSKYRREILPGNVRKFNLQIYIKEIRNFNTVLNAIDKLSELGVPQNTSVAETSGFFEGRSGPALDFMRENSKETARVVNDNTSSIIYTFFGCEIDPTVGSELFSTVSNSETEVAKNKFSITYSDVEEQANFALLDFIVKDFITDNTDTQTFEEKLKDRINNLAKESLLNQSERIVNSAEQFARAKANDIILGNVYGKVVGSSALNALARGTIDGTVRDIDAERAVLNRINGNG